MMEQNHSSFKHNYSSVLRLSVPKEPYRDDLLKFLARYRGAFDAAVFFASLTHDILSIRKMKELLEAIVPLADETKRLGYKTGINILTTLGHHAEVPDPEMAGMDFLVRSDGSVNQGALCPTSEKTLAHIKELYRLAGGTGADIVYSDDDLSYNCSCYCKSCLEKFGPLNREDLIKAFTSDDYDERKSWRERWLAFYRERLNVVYRIIEEAVHGVNPGAAIGFMCCNSGGDGSGMDEWAAISKGSGGEVLCRPGGGLYADMIPARVMEKADRIGLQLRYLPDWTGAQAEIECFPVQSLRKGVQFSSFEALTYLASGCTGTAWSMVVPSAECGPEDAERFFALAEKLRPFAEKLTQTFGRNGGRGVCSYWDRDSAANPGAKEWNAGIVRETELYNIGLPVCYNPEDACVFLLNGQMAAGLSEGQLEAVLKKAVFMDAEAAGILVRRGFGAYTGFDKAEGYIKNVREEILPNSLYGGLAGCIRNIHLEFSINGHPEFGKKAAPVYSLVKTAPGAEFTSKLTGYLGKEYGYGGGIFENEFGGRVYVGGYAAFDWCYTGPRARELKILFRWLSKGSMGAYIKSWEKIALWNRRTVDGGWGVTLANISLDPVRNLEVAVKRESGTAKAVLFDGQEAVEYALDIRPEKDGYGVITVPHFPALTAGYIVFQEEEFL
jgi:hypothetical protein